MNDTAVPETEDAQQAEPGEWLTRTPAQVGLMLVATWGMFLLLISPALVFVPVLAAAAYGYGIGWDDGELAGRRRARRRRTGR